MSVELAKIHFLFSCVLYLFKKCNSYFVFPLFQGKSINRAHRNGKGHKIKRTVGEGMLSIKVMPINQVRSMWFCPQSAVLPDGCLPKACGPDGCLFSTWGGLTTIWACAYFIGSCDGLVQSFLQSPDTSDKTINLCPLSSHHSSMSRIHVFYFLLS